MEFASIGWRKDSAQYSLLSWGPPPPNPVSLLFSVEVRNTAPWLRAANNCETQLGRAGMTEAGMGPDWQLVIIVLKKPARPA